MLGSSLEGLAGLVLAVLTLRDVFDTVVVPQRTHGLLKVPRRLVFAVLPLHKRLRRRGVAVHFAPGILVTSFVVWMLLLVLAFGLLLHAVQDQFDPPLGGFGEALYAAGGAMATIGFGMSEPHGLAAVVAVAGGFCGLAVMTLAITYLLEVQGNIAIRDKGVLEMTTVAGKPPTAIRVLERYGELGCRGELASTLREGRQWCAAVLQSHVSHPTLIYFRSAGTGTGWPAAIGSLCDLALIAELLLDEREAFGPGVLAREACDRLAKDVSALLDLETPATSGSLEEAEELVDRLAASGYRLRPDRDLELFVRERSRHLAGVEALARHLGTAPPRLLPLEE